MASSDCGCGGEPRPFMGRQGQEDRGVSTVSTSTAASGLVRTGRLSRIVPSFPLERMFVRGLQASYNQVSAKTGYKVPFGSMIVFGLSCGQIMFAFLLSPSTIPPEYNSWQVRLHISPPSSQLIVLVGTIGFNRLLECKRAQ